jgi:ribosomal protein S20
MAEAAAKGKFPERQKSAQKRAGQSQRRGAKNKAHKSTIHTAKLGYLDLVGKKDAKAQEELKNLHRLVDKAKGFFHPNKVARLKSRLTKKAAM